MKKETETNYQDWADIFEDEKTVGHVINCEADRLTEHELKERWKGVEDSFAEMVNKGWWKKPEYIQKQVIGPYEHSLIVWAYAEGCAMDSISTTLRRAVSAVARQIKEHNSTVQTLSQCETCRSVKGHSIYDMHSKDLIRRGSNFYVPFESLFGPRPSPEELEIGLAALKAEESSAPKPAKDPNLLPETQQPESDYNT